MYFNILLIGPRFDGNSNIWDGQINCFLNPKVRGLRHPCVTLAWVLFKEWLEIVSEQRPGLVLWQLPRQLFYILAKVLDLKVNLLFAFK